MSHSEALTTRDVRRGMRLVAEAVELGDDPIRWRTHLLEGLFGLLGARSFGAMGVMCHPINPAQVAMPVDVWAGFNGEQRELMNRYLAGGNLNADPVTPAIVGMGPRRFTRTREQLCSDRTWYRSSYFNEVRRPINSDDLIYSQLMLNSGKHSSGLGITRALDSRPFTRRQRAIVHIVHNELGRLWARGPAGSTPSLGPRLRRVLELLCRGDGEKQIALQLELSRTTIHNYVGMLHRKLGVHSRGELVAAGLTLSRRMGPKVLPD